MNATFRFGRIALLASVLVASGVSYGWLRSADSSQQTSVAVSLGTKTPKQVLIIRHGEKANDESDIHLNSRGAARAAALPSLFVIPPTFPTRPAPFATPDFIYATRESKHSNRPVETVTPLSKALGGMLIHQKHSDKDFQDVVDSIFNDSKHASKTVLISWHHGKIPELGHAIAIRAKNADKLKSQISKHWEGAVFDRVWLFTFDDKGHATFANQPQQLLFGDAKK